MKTPKRLKRGPILKIDTSKINLYSTHSYSETDKTIIDTELTFSNLLDSQMGIGTPALSMTRELSVETTVSMLDLTTFAGQDAVSLSRQFIKEVKKLQQILDSILSYLNRSGRGCSIELARLDLININPPSLGQGALFSYDLRRTQTFTHYEREQTNFAANGTVTTQDGKQIDFDFQMDLEREFFREDQVVWHEKGYALIDPLVIHLDTAMPQLSQTRFSFDLDMDGIPEDLPGLMPGTGLLSLDKNKDGIINDGSELFGPSTGTGFGELAEYDLDQNMWIDENDPIFEALTLWENDEDGEMKLTKIKDAGIGAIYLAEMNTPFDLRDENNGLQAKIKSTGIALDEAGSVRPVQEINWTV